MIFLKQGVLVYNLVEWLGDDFERIPLLVRHKKVAAALEWLKLNHQDYLFTAVDSGSLLNMDSL